MHEIIEALNHLKPPYMILVQACIVLLIPYLLWRTAGLSKWVPLGVVQICSGVLLGPAIFGALFLKRFVTVHPCWLHVDLYAWNPRERPGRPVGAELQGVRACYRWLMQRYGTVT